MLGLARAAVIQLYGWVALATVTLLSLSARSNAPQAAHNTGAIRGAQLTDMTSLEWRALASECAESLFAIGAFHIAGRGFADEDWGAQFTVEGYSKEFVFTRDVLLDHPPGEMLEVRFVVLSREEFPELHQLYAEINERHQRMR